MGLYRFALAPRREPSPDPLIRIFQSETAEIREGREPAQLRVTLYAVAGLFVALLAVSVVMPMNRVVTSVFGEIVTTEPTIVLQALDESIIKTLDVQEGEIVKAGHLLATLDPTFTAADVSALTLQIASLDAADRPLRGGACAHEDFDPPAGTTPQAAYMALQKDYYLQRKAQFDAQLLAYNEQIAQNQPRSASSKRTSRHYDDRVKVSQEIENMRASLAASQVGSRLNLLDRHRSAGRDAAQPRFRPQRSGRKPSTSSPRRSPTATHSSSNGPDKSARSWSPPGIRSTARASSWQRQTGTMTSCAWRRRRTPWS